MASASSPTAAPTSPAAVGKWSVNAALQLPRNPQTPGPKAVSVQRRPEPKPRRTKNTQPKAAPNQSHFQSKAGPVQNHAGPKAASLFRPCRWVRNHQPVPKTPGKSGSAKSPPQDAQLKSARQDALSRTARKGTRPGKRHPTNAPAKTGPQIPPRENRPAKTGPKDPLRTQHPERPPCKPSCGPKIAGKFGVPQQNRYLRTYRTTPAAGQYSRPSDRLPGKSTA